MQKSARNIRKRLNTLFWVLTLDLPLTSYDTLGKVLNLSDSEYHIYYHKGIIIPGYCEDYYVMLIYKGFINHEFLNIC